MSLARRLKTPHLRLILRIADTGKLHAAAEDIAISQPVASRMLAEIEALIDAPLFSRHAKGMEPTAIGETVLRHARQILQDFDKLEMDVQEVTEGRAGSVRIGTVTGPAVGKVVPVIRTIQQRAPEVQFTIEVAPSSTLMRGLDDGRFDFIIGRPEPDDNTRNYRIYPSRNEVVSMLIRRDHPMVGCKSVHLRELIDFEWVIQDRGTPIRAAVEDAFHINRLQLPRQITNTSSLLVALALLKDSTAIAPLSHEVAELLTGSALDVNVSRLDLAEDILVSPFFVVVRRDRQLSPVAEHVLQETFRRL